MTSLQGQISLFFARDGLCVVREHRTGSLRSATSASKPAPTPTLAAAATLRWLVRRLEDDVEMGEQSTPSANSPPVVLPPPLHELIWSRYRKLLDIKRRLYWMRAYLTELERVTRLKRFTIRNDVLWNMCLDTRDKCVIDLYSFSVELRHGIPPKDPKAGRNREQLAKRGFFIELRDHYASALCRTYTEHPDDDLDEVERSRRSTAEHFEKLFPGVAHDVATKEDIENLCESFRLKMVPVGRDRNQNRAHVYEGEPGQAKMHSIDELRDLFDYTERMFRSLSLVSAGADLDGGNMNVASCNDTAIDVVDMILLGHRSELESLFSRRSRDDLYARLHEFDDAGQQDEDDEGPGYRHFNDYRFSMEFFAPPH